MMVNEDSDDIQAKEPSKSEPIIEKIIQDKIVPLLADDEPDDTGEKSTEVAGAASSDDISYHAGDDIKSVDSVEDETFNNSESDQGATNTNLDEQDQVPNAPTRTDFPISSDKSMCGFSLDKEVANIDLFLYRTCRYVILSWLALIAVSYWAAPNESIVWLEGTEKNAAMTELCILTTAVVTRHLPLFWDMKRDAGNVPPRISGVLAGGLTVQLVAIFTTLWMVMFPVPVMIDPVFHSRVHLLRWCEWTPLAGFMTLLMQCIDAPTMEEGKWSSHFKYKLFSASLESFSTFCGLLFPFCPNRLCWNVCMTISFSTFFYIYYSYAQKLKDFRQIVRGWSEDHIELYERARLSLDLHWLCCFTWTMITVMYFVGSCGHLIVPKSYKWLHDPAIMMMEECFMDAIAKILYMSLIIEADSVAFDEAKRANRRLAELKNTMSVVWENSSDTIAISVQTISGNITSMISPSFFREALIAKREELNDITAVVLEMDKPSINSRKDSFTNVSTRMELGDLTSVSMKIIYKEDFARLDLHSPVSKNIFNPLTRQRAKKNDLLSYQVIAFSDMLSRAWQTKRRETVFEHDVSPRAGSGPRIKFEVKVTKLEEHAIVVVIRDVSERYRRFEAEKRFVIETTARQKDAEANRFARHEIKNGILSAIEICSNIRELSTDFNKLQNAGSHITSQQSTSGRIESITELDVTLHEVLDIVLAETMAKDVIHEMYEPKLNRVDINHLLSHIKGYTGSNFRFEFISSPSPLPPILSDQGLLKCIYSNALRNAIKYGKPGGKITTMATYSVDAGSLEIKVINLPGPDHHKLIDMGDRASDLVFSHGTRLHKDSIPAGKSFSAGDGAWIMKKCATILGGTVGIIFKPDQTTFILKTPVKLYDTSKEANTFVLPPDVWGIAIDDSKIQRKLLRRFFIHAGIHEHHQVILGQNSNEILKFVEFTVNFIKRHPNDRFFVITDENLELGEELAIRHETLSGSKCIQQIRKALDPKDEKRVLALVRSANDSQNDMALYLSRAHGYIPKVPLRVMSVKETVYSLWKERFPSKTDHLYPGEQHTEQERDLTRISSLENLRDLTLISSAELLEEIDQIDAICIRDCTELNRCDRWRGLWDKLHQLKGDLKSANVDERYSEAIAVIETMRGANAPIDFLENWFRIRSKVIEKY